MLIREVAYAGLAKASRAAYHQRFAAWLGEQRRRGAARDPRLPPRPGGGAARPSSTGRRRPSSSRDAAATLTRAGKRALAQEANRAARRQLSRAAELEPTLERRYEAAQAAWRLGDIPTVWVEMRAVRRRRERGRRHAASRRARCTALAEVVLYRDGDIDDGPGARRARARARSTARTTRPATTRSRSSSLVGWWTGNLSDVERYSSEMLALARARWPQGPRLAGADDAWPSVALSRLEDERADELLPRAVELAEASGSLLRAHGGVPVAGRPRRPARRPRRGRGGLRAARASSRRRRARPRRSPASCATSRRSSSSRARPHAPRSCCASRSACSARWTAAARSSRRCARWPSCCCARARSTRPSGSRSRRARCSRRTTSRRG